jgi:hypothetical protein
MASISITVQSLLNIGEYDPYTVDDGTTVSTFSSTIGTAKSWDTSWFNLVYNNIELDGTKTLAFYSITDGSQVRMANKIARLTTLEDRQVAKLTLAQQERLDLSNPYPYYDISELPTYYDGNVVVDNTNPDGLIEGRPWVASAPTPPSPGYTWTPPSGWQGYEIFDGSTQRLSTPASSDWAPGTGAFTVEFVVNFQAGGGSFPRVFSLGTYPGASIACSIEGTDAPTVYFWMNGGIAASIDTSGPLFTGMPSFRNNWHHVVLQRNTSGWVNIYIDGNKVTTNTTANTTNLNDTTHALALAVEPQSGGSYSNYMKGYLTNFRWTNAAVYPDTSFTVMSAELTALAQTKLLLLMQTSGTLNTDSSASAHTVTATGSPTWHTA